jgi:hypothetical protein
MARSFDFGSRKRLIGHDTSENASTPSVLCAECGSDADGSPVYAGDEWGRVLDSHCCSECGRDLSEDGLVLVPRTLD